MDELNSWADAFRGVLGDAVGAYTSIEVAKANRDATRAAQYDQMMGQYYVPGQRYAMPSASSGMSQGALLLVGAALVGVLLIMRR